MPSSSSALPLPAAPSPGLRLPLCLPVTYRGARRSGVGRSTKPGHRAAHEFSYTHAPGCRAQPLAGLVCPEKVGPGLAGGTTETILSSLTRRHSQIARTSGGKTTPRLAHSSFTPCDIRPYAPPPERGHGVEEANANPDPDPDPERQPIKGSKTPVRVLPGVGRDRPEAPRTHPQEGGWED